MRAMRMEFSTFFARHDVAMLWRVAPLAMMTGLKIPALRVGDEKIAERLHARHGLELFGIDEVGVECLGFGLAEQLHQAAVLLDQIIRQHGDAESALAGAQEAEDVVDEEVRYAWAFAVARHLDQPARALQVGWH